MSKMYKRVCEMNINGRTLKYPPMTLEFETSFSLKSPSQTKAKIMNPSPDTVSICEKIGSMYPVVTISAGYEEDYGTCVTGEIVKFSTRPGVDRALELTISDKTSLWSNTIINKSFSGFITARAVAMQILAEKGVVPAEMFFGAEKTYPYGVSFSGVTLRAAMERIARDTKSVFAFRNGQATFLSEMTGSVSALVLGYGSGLISAEKTGKGYKIKSLFMYKIKGGSLVVLNKGLETANLKVTKGKSVFSPGNAYTEFEAKTL